MYRKIALPICFSIALLAAPAPVRGDASNDYFRLARISFLDGHVSFQHPGEVDWTAASINMPLQPGDRIYTGNEGRAEVEFDDGSVYRLAENTDSEILSLRDDLIQLRVLLGLTTLTVNSGVNFEVDTPAAAFNTLRKGVYRFDVIENGDTDAIVRKGLLEAANDDFSRQVDSGELLHIAMDAGGSSAPVLSRYEQRDEWDDWNDRRNADLMAYGSRQHIPDNVNIGVSELDTYGRWVVVDPYGPAWIPYSVGPTWSPYWEGRWCYRPFWGWTWVSYEPWGWLPYHYGRWYYSGGFGWCWLPGASFSFNFWSPGLVRFFSGPGWVSWCPLGPLDYYNVNNYYFSRSHQYQLNNLRLLQTRAPDNLMNRNAPGAFRTVHENAFISRNFGHGRIEQAEPIDQPWLRGRIVTGRLSVKPTAMSYAPAPDRPATRPVIESGHRFVVRTEPSAKTIPEDRMVRITNRRLTPLPTPVIRRGTEPARDTGRSSTVTVPADRDVSPAAGKSRTYQPAPANRNSGAEKGNSAPQTRRPTVTPERQRNVSPPPSQNNDRSRRGSAPRSELKAAPRKESAPAERKRDTPKPQTKPPGKSR